jgi:hypothetical protein
MNRVNLELFTTGLIQVILVCLNTYQIAVYAVTKSPLLLVGIVVVGFLISFIWTLNVKKVAFGNLSNRIFYSAGAATGSCIGVLLGSLIYSI